MNKKVICLVLGAMLFALCSLAGAQQAGKSPALVFWIQAMLLVAWSSWMRSDKS
jgi:hypothetical protein